MRGGEYVIVEQVQHELLEAPETTYNFEVADFHTYYVGETEVLVRDQSTAKKVSTSRPSSVADGKITGYTKHGLEQTMGRDGHGVSPKAILDIVKIQLKWLNKPNEIP